MTDPTVIVCKPRDYPRFLSLYQAVQDANQRCVCGHKRKHHDERDGGTEPRWLACKGFLPEGD